MLLGLTIYNFALIKKLQLDLSSGLNIITGETGAGKSIIIKALEMLSGGRASTDYIRSGESKAIIEANYSIKDKQKVQDKLESLGIDYQIAEGIILTREITHNGNNCSRINGRIVPLKDTRAICQDLIEIHSQHEHQSLFQSRKQLALLDEFGGSKLNKVLEQVESSYQQLAAKKEKMAQLSQDEKEQARRIDLLKFQLEEIDEAQLSPGEDKELLAAKKRLGNMEEITQTVGRIYSQLYESSFESEAVVDQLQQFGKELAGISDFDDELEAINDQLQEATYQLQEVAYQLEDYQHSLEFSPQRLNEIEKRLQLINQLKRKYGDNVAEILDYRAQIQSELEDLESRDKQLEELAVEIKQLEEDYLTAADELSRLRQEAAAEFEVKILAELEDLSMEQSKFKIELTPRIDKSDDHLELADLTSYGIDQIEFLIAPNPGEELKPLAKIASGGELSRSMLAIKKVIAESDEVTTMVFDEVDSGIGGRIADLVAEKLAIIAANHQVICITHLPQIASMGDVHYHISKSVNQQRTKTELKRLNQDERINELARMLSGSSLTDATIEHAAEMIKLARKKKEALLDSEAE
ncbi:MAG: DNA repair protein RecN [Bacillota bacterium]